MIYQTDVKCPKKGEYAYFIKLNNELFCIATTESYSYWGTSDKDLNNLITELDCLTLTENQFFTQKHFGKCKSKLSKEMIQFMYRLKNV